LIVAALETLQAGSGQASSAGLFKPNQRPGKARFINLRTLTLMIKPVLFDVMVEKKTTAEAMASGGVGVQEAIVQDCRLLLDQNLGFPGWNGDSWGCSGWMQGAFFCPLFVEAGKERKKSLGFVKTGRNMRT
jgi:hypothetical protein